MDVQLYLSACKLTCVFEGCFDSLFVIFFPGWDRVLEQLTLCCYPFYVERIMIGPLLSHLWASCLFAEKNFETDSTINTFFLKTTPANNETGSGWIRRQFLLVYS